MYIHEGTNNDKSQLKMLEGGMKLHLCALHLCQKTDSFISSRKNEKPFSRI